MRLAPGVISIIVLAATPAVAQPVPAMEPAPPPPMPTAYYPPPAPYPAPIVEPPRRRSWFGIVGAAGMGYVGRQGTDPQSASGDTDTGGFALEAVGGRWIRHDFAIGGRVEAHTDDAELYTNSSLTVVARIPISATRRFYLEPGFGLAFHKTESTQNTEGGIAVAMTAGYAMMRRRFAFDLRFGVAHYRIDHPDPSSSLDHGTVWVGFAIGLQ